MGGAVGVLVVGILLLLVAVGWVAAGALVLLSLGSAVLRALAVGARLLVLVLGLGSLVAILSGGLVGLVRALLALLAVAGALVLLGLGLLVAAVGGDLRLRLGGSGNVAGELSGVGEVADRGGREAGLLLEAVGIVATLGRLVLVLLVGWLLVALLAVRGTASSRVSGGGVVAVVVAGGSDGNSHGEGERFHLFGWFRI